MILECKPNLPAAWDLFFRGQAVLTEASLNGIRIDAEYFREQLDRLEKKQHVLEETVWASPLGTEWKKKHGAKANLRSGPQLSILPSVVKASKHTTKTGRVSVNAEDVKGLRVEGVESLLVFRKLDKARSVIENLLGEAMDRGEYLHPSFNLHLVRTYRSSSNNPNFQNLPIRDKEMGEIIRSGIIPRPGRCLVEIDYSGIEVRIAACYHQDPTMLKYIRDPSSDLHRDMAMACYKIDKPEQVTKDARYCAKNGFVFPEFYGAWWKDVAPDLWDKAAEFKLTVDDVPMREHLKEKGIRNLAQFTSHIEAVEKHFWKKRFPVYDEWKSKWFDRYLKRGWFAMLTGFVCDGDMRRNEVINYPVQGVAFHCLLWSLIRLRKRMRKELPGALILGQIHDSGIFECHWDQVRDLARIAKEVMCEEIAEEWKWLVVPLGVEVEAAEPDEPWFKKHKVEV